MSESESKNSDGPVQPRGPVIERKEGLPRRRALLPFVWTECDRRFFAQPQMPFLARGLAIWGAPPGATVTCWIGVHLELVAGWGNVPAKFFGSGQNFEQIAKLLDAGQEPPEWCTFHECEVGNLVRLVVADREGKSLGPHDGVELVMWGHAIGF